MSKYIIACALIFAFVWFGGCKTSEVLPPAPTSPTTPEKTIADPAGSTISGTSIWTTAVEPKLLSDQVKTGLAWLVSKQQENGGWAQGEESQQMGHGMDAVKDTPNVGDTCAATLALIRSGSNPKEGEYAQQICKAVAFVCGEVETADKESLFITSLRGTRLQAKLGQYVDTFLASMLLAEVRGRMPDADSEKRVFDALDKVLDKIERHQQADGSWVQDGWAPTLSLGMATKGLNRAAQAGAQVQQEVLQRAANRERDKFKKGDYEEGSAGVDLYGKASNQAALQDAQNTDNARKLELEKVAETSPDEKVREKAADDIKAIEENEKVLTDATKDTVQKLSDQKFIQGFGSNGGEEFLSYLNLSESLVVKGGEDWTKWDDTMTRNLNNIQNQDGSWTGHHCITGRTFCTSAALLVLMADRTPVPIAAKIKPNP